MKIDTTQIPNFDALPEEAKAAILAIDVAEAPDMSQYVAKSVFDKKASEAADLGKQLRARMTEEELSKAKAAEDMAAIQEELRQLRTEKAVNEHAAKFLGLGYDEKLAFETAAAMTNGEMDIVFKNHAKFLADREKTLRAEILRETPVPPAGNGSTGKTKEDFSKMTLLEKQKFAQENPEQYKEFYGGN